MPEGDPLPQRLGAAPATRRAGADPVRRSLERFRRQVRRRAAAGASDAFFRGLSAVARMHPRSRPERHQVEVLRDLPYRDTGLPEHTLDIYRPSVRPGPFPVVLYVHGGGFRLLSKDTHWVMGLAFARFGYMVVNISYRLAPQHCYPAPLEDVCAAYRWTLANAARYGGDTSRLVVAGESAGANLVTALTAATCYRRPEPWAREVFDAGVVPAATLPACGILQVSNTLRFGERRTLPSWVNVILDDVESCYLGEGPRAGDEPSLADPLLIFESGRKPDRPLPPFFVPVGTRDPLLDDTRRLAAALEDLGAVCEARYYRGEIHAFHALVWRKRARRCWQDTFAFLDRHLRARRLRYDGTTEPPDVAA